MTDGPSRRLRRLDWDELSRRLDADGIAVTGEPVLSRSHCYELRDRFDDDAHFRSTIVMERHRYGEGVYRYLRYPLPDAVAELREVAYESLVPIANRWLELLGSPPLPDSLDAMLERCRRAGQSRPTPLILRYGPGGYNCLHQDRYGEVAFPLQLAVALSAPGHDFTGGENVFVEQRPREQSRAHAVTLPLGHAVIFANDQRPVPSARGHRRVTMRHGVSTVHSGSRVALGVIFHDAA